MIQLDVAQGSSEWLHARIGLPTASQFSRLLTEKTLKFSAQAEPYAWQLIAEQVLGAPMDDVSSTFVERGTDMERRAVSFYELQRDVTTEVAGFCLRDDRRVGCSPDRFVSTDGLLEIKVPSAKVHIGYLLDDQGIGYRAQCQGALWVCERDWIDTLSYHPVLPSALVRQHRDEEFIGKLAAAVQQFLAMMDDMKDRLQQRYGMFADEEFPALQLVADAGEQKETED